MNVNIYTEKCNLFLITELCINPMQRYSKLALLHHFLPKQKCDVCEKEECVSAGEEVEDYRFDFLLLCHKHTPD